MSKPHTSKPSKKHAAAPQSEPINVTITIDERDTINAAKGRIRRLAAVLTDVLNTDSDMEWSEDTRNGLSDLVDLIRDDATAIHEAFTSADVRQDEKGAR